VRILVLLFAGGERGGAIGGPQDAVAVIRAESRLQAMDFWLRNPDYLALELLELYEVRGGDASYLALARDVLVDDDPEMRTFPMLRYLFGAWEELDAALNLLRCYRLAIQIRRGQDESRRRDFYLLERGETLIVDAIADSEVLGWYAERARLVAKVAGACGGDELKRHQKEQQEYRNTRWGNLIAPVRERVQARLEGLESEAGL
jgi:hypothetical protein